jgi:hypothetical protein
MRQNPINLVLYFFLEIAVAAIVSSCGIPATATPAPPPTTTLTSAPPPTSAPETPLTDEPLPTVTPVCISSEPTQSDIDRALSYIGDTFNMPEWEQSYTVNDANVAVLWQNVPQSALVYLETRIKPCGYEEPDLNKEFSDENWKAVFANYESYELIDECKNNDGLRLYEFKTQNQGLEYEINYWVENDTDTRIIVTMIVFPLETELLLDKYSSTLFPDYSTCP